MDLERQKKQSAQVSSGEVCVHCGAACEATTVRNDAGSFCCEGCQTIYSLLHDGAPLRIPSKEKWAFLEEASIQEILIQYSDDKISRVRLELPGIHCSSCIQILESLPRVHEGVVSSRLLFSQREIHITFYHQVIGLREVVELLDYLSYPPKITQVDERGKEVVRGDSDLIKKLGVAGFVFGNVMLMSFPGYLGMDDVLFETLFGYLSLGLCIPLMTFAARDYLSSAYSALLNRSLNIDVSISLGMMALFLKSAYDILTHTSSGYLDSLAGFIFFLLVGKWIQQKTYRFISFERRYEDYFPLYATIKSEQGKKYVPLSQIQAGDFILVAKGEMVPCDGLNVSDSARIDYSFVTGESDAIKVDSGEKIFAGGQNVGSTIEVLVNKSSDQSYLTSLWQEEVFGREKEVDSKGFIQVAGKYFTITILCIAAVTLAFWLYADPSKAWFAFTSVLIIACPCVLALTTPFTLGTLRSLWGQKGVYFRNTQTLELLGDSTDVVFDKTGTLTSPEHKEMTFDVELNSHELSWVHSLTALSNHPLSLSIAHALRPYPVLEVVEFEELEGKGLRGRVAGHSIRLGSHAYIYGSDQRRSRTEVWLEIDGTIKGCITVSNPLKKEVGLMIEALQKESKIHLLSGDHDYQKELFVEDLGIPENHCHFRQSPHQKLQYIERLQERQRTTLMVGDGLNDAGAFQQSDISAVVSKNLNNFTPSSDIILVDKSLSFLPQLMHQSRAMKKVIAVMYGLSLLYNGVGLYFAVQGLLSPIVAAILMPISSLSIVIVGTALTYAVYKKVN